MKNLNAERKWIHELVLNKYDADPESFRECFPDLAQAIESVRSPESRSGSPSKLTENERQDRLQSLKQLVGALEGREASSADAVKALSVCAVLIEDGSLPPEIDHQVVVKMISRAIDAPLSGIKSNKTLPISEGTLVYRVAVVRGVILNLSWDFGLLSIEINPTRVRERPKALRFVGEF